MKYLVQTETFTPGKWSSHQTSLRLVVLEPKPRAQKRCINWNRMLGLATIFGVSAAGWTGIALLVSRLVK